MKAQAVEEHLFAEDVHLLNIDEQGGHTGPDDGAVQIKSGGQVNLACMKWLFTLLSFFSLELIDLHIIQM